MRSRSTRDTARKIDAVSISNSKEPILYIVDEMPLTRAQLSQFLSGFARLHGLRIEEIAASEAGDIFPQATGGMCVINTGASTSDEIWFGIVRTLSQTARFGPVVLFCEAASAEFVRGALQAGARGVVPASTNPAVALKSLDLTLHGGIFVPPSVLDLLQSSEPSREPGAAPSGDPEQLPDLSGRTSGDHGAAPRTVAAAPRMSPRQTRTEQAGDPGDAAESDEPDLADLTPRQLAVLDHLGKARSNKEIARVLDTTEATVKLHVRQVMRKLGAKNRTEAALIAARRELAKRPTPRLRSVPVPDPATPARTPIYQPLPNQRNLHAAALLADGKNPAPGFFTAAREKDGDTRAAEHLRRIEKSATMHFPGVFPGPGRLS